MKSICQAPARRGRAEGDGDIRAARVLDAASRRRKGDAGAPVIECEMVEEDFKEMVAAGVKLLGEVGLGGVKDGPTARRWSAGRANTASRARSTPAALRSPVRGRSTRTWCWKPTLTSSATSMAVTPRCPTIRSVASARAASAGWSWSITVMSVLRCIRCASRARWATPPRILGTDAPAGSGVQPLGILRMVSLLSSLGELPAEIAFCLATGNTARMRALDCGLIEVGRAADFVIMDKAQHSPGKNILESVQLGDLPGVGMTIIDGIVRTQRAAIPRRLTGSRKSWGTDDR